MKTSILLAALLTVSAANAQETQFKWGGELGVQYESFENLGFGKTGASNDFVQTTKLHVDIAKSENLMGKITLRNLALWGTGYSSNETAYKTNFGTENTLMVEEAYGVWRTSEAGALQFGRGSFEMATGELVSKAGDQTYVPISFDGILYTHDFEPVRVGAFGVRAVDLGMNRAEHGGAAAANNNDGHFFGVTLDVKTIPEFLNKVHFHYVGAKSSTNGTNIPKNERTWIGTNIAGETGAFDYSFNYENFSGKTEMTSLNAALGDFDREGDMFNLALGFNMPEAMGMRLGVSYHQSSGDKSGASPTTPGGRADSDAYDSFNYDQRKYTGRMGLVRWGNGFAGTNSVMGTGLESIAVHFKMEPREGLKVFADYYMFTAAEKQGGTEDEIGQELDLGIEKTYSNGFKTSLEYGMFTAGDLLGANAEDVTRIAVTAGFTF